MHKQLSPWLFVVMAGCSIGLRPGVIAFDSGESSDFWDGDDDDDDDDAHGDGTDTGLISDTDDSDATGTVSIESVTPDQGPNAGGTEVTLSGGPFDGDPKVWFGDTLAMVSSSSANTLVVQTPAYKSYGQVDVDVVTDDGQGSLANGFQFHEDQSGKTGLVGHISWYDYVGDAWASNVGFGHSWASLITPTDHSWWHFYANSLDTCAGNMGQIGLEGITDHIDLYDIDEDALTLTSSGGTSLSLPFSSSSLVDPVRGLIGEGYVHDDLTSLEYSAGNWFSLNEVTSSELPSFSAENVVQTPSSFNVTRPDFDGMSIETVTRSNFTVQWQSSNSGEAVIIIPQVVDNTGLKVYDSQFCVARDDGNFTIDQSGWSDWRSGNYLIIFVGRLYETTSSLPWNNADIRISGIYWNIGVARAQ